VSGNKKKKKPYEVPFSHRRWLSLSLSFSLFSYAVKREDECNQIHIFATVGML
jgi:hypothetical protein